MQARRSWFPAFFVSIREYVWLKAEVVERESAHTVGAHVGLFGWFLLGRLVVWLVFGWVVWLVFGLVGLEMTKVGWRKTTNDRSVEQQGSITWDTASELDLAIGT